VDRGYIHPLVVLVVQEKLQQSWPGGKSFHASVCVMVVDVQIVDMTDCCFIDLWP
jgi:hypothetical protein